jgi:hypothetical protein
MCVCVYVKAYQKSLSNNTYTKHIYIYIYTHTHTHTYIYIYVYIHTQQLMHNLAFKTSPDSTYTNIHTYTHTYIHTHIHTYTHTYTQQLMHDLALKSLSRQHIRGTHTYDDTPAGKIHALFHFMACPPPQHAGSNPDWVRKRALHWVRMRLLPRIYAEGANIYAGSATPDNGDAKSGQNKQRNNNKGSADNGANTASSSWKKDANLAAQMRVFAERLPRDNTMFQHGDNVHIQGGLRFDNDVLQLDEVTWTSLTNGKAMRRVNKDNGGDRLSRSTVKRHGADEGSSRRRGIFEAGDDEFSYGNESGYPDSTQSETAYTDVDLNNSQAHLSVKWWCVLAYKDTHAQSLVTMYQTIAWNFPFRFYTLDVSANAGMGAMLNIEVTPCLRLYSDDGKYREFFGDVSNGARVQAFIENFEECHVEEQTSVDWMPLARFLEVPDGVQEYMDACLSLSIQAEREGTCLVRPVPGVLEQLRGHSLELVNVDLSGMQVSACLHLCICVCMYVCMYSQATVWS